MKHKIIDNFLDKNFYKEITRDLKGGDIPWYYQNTDVPQGGNKNGYFSFCYYFNNRPNTPLFEKHIEPILKKLNSATCVLVKANLVFRDVNTVDTNYHTDNECSHSKTGILYLSNCNAKTILKIKNKKISVDSVENRLLLFDTKIEHKVIYQTDIHKRYVINFNYIPNK